MTNADTVLLAALVAGATVADAASRSGVQHRAAPTRAGRGQHRRERRARPAVRRVVPTRLAGGANALASRAPRPGRAVVELARLVSAPTAHPAGDDTACRAPLHCSLRPRAGPWATPVTLECTPVDIAMSVGEADGAVYSPTVLRLRG